LDWHYKIGPSTDHRAKFHACRPTHFGDLARTKKNKTSGLKHKSFRKLSFSGGLKIDFKSRFQIVWFRILPNTAAGVHKQACSTNLYHSRQCGIILKFIYADTYLPLCFILDMYYT